MGVRKCTCCELFEDVFPPESFARIWARQYEEGHIPEAEPKLGLDGTGIFTIIKWNCDCVHLYLRNPVNPGAPPIRQLVVKCKDIVAIRRRPDPLNQV